jgi:hypothetical protein
LQFIEARSFKVREELAVQEKPVCGHAQFAKTDGFCVTHHLHNVRMLERFAPLQTEAHDVELPHMVHPLLEISQGRMRNRVVELVAIVAIQVALFGHVQVRSPRFGVKNATDLLEIEHSFPYHSHRRQATSRKYSAVRLRALTSLKRFKPVDEFADSEINASFGKTVDAFSHE